MLPSLFYYIRGVAAQMTVIMMVVLEGHGLAASLRRAKKLPLAHLARLMIFSLSAVVRKRLERRLLVVTILNRILR
jgi:hypothetical protein